jgi:aminoglycoside phosphotransferase (APT) family kinase protein
MHPDELHTDVPLVRRLLASQFPQWADLPIARVESSGTDNAIYRLGDDLAVRLPRIGWAKALAEKEQRWLPRLAPHLPLPIPVPLAMGAPGEGYPWHWSVCPWLEGDNAIAQDIAHSETGAVALAGFIAALHRIDAHEGPPAGPDNFFRGVPLADLDERRRESIAQNEGMADTKALTDAWDAALAEPAWDGPPVWVHGDLLPGNVLVRDGRLSAVIDFGCLGVGDPACDVIPAWALFSSTAREAFRRALDVDDATWGRGRGWALSFAVSALPHYRESNPVLAEVARRTITEVLADPA